ncbi:MAG TPA: HesA/MoeB/ThiF family protein [Bacillota bacterium]|nr:HesA/MoeB/ThiF family protein [Bacillota bacterium]
MKTLTDLESVRWKRQIQIPQFGTEAQQRLKESTVAVLGVGAIGGASALYLAAAGIGRLILADRDVVELSNLNRQILFTTDDLGKSKAQLAGKRLQELDPGVETQVVVCDIGEEELPGLLGDCNFVLCCFDKNKSRFLVNWECVRRNLPATYGFAQDFSGELITSLPGKTACLACIMDDSFPEPEETPIIGPASGIVGIAMAAAAIRYLTEIGELMAGYRLVYDLAFPELLKIPLERNPACPVCGRKDLG